MEDEKPEEIEARIRRARLFTCPCCLLGWESALKLRAHLAEQLKKITAKLQEIARL